MSKNSITLDQLRSAANAEVSLAEFARAHKATLDEVRRAEAVHGVLLPRGGTGPAPAKLDLDAIYQQAAQTSIRRLARALDMSATQLTHRLQAHAAAYDLGWPPGEPQPPQAQELYRARVRTCVASARLGLKGGRSQEAASWMTVAEEVGLDVGLEGTALEQYAMQQARYWARGSGRELPWGRELTSARWDEEEREVRGAQLRGVLLSGLVEHEAPPRQAAHALQALEDGPLVLLDAYALDNALDALNTATATPERPYHQLRAEAVAALDGLLSTLAESSTRSPDRWREIVEEILTEVDDD